MAGKKLRKAVLQFLIAGEQEATVVVDNLPIELKRYVSENGDSVEMGLTSFVGHNIDGILDWSTQFWNKVFYLYIR